MARRSRRARRPGCIARSSETARPIRSPGIADLTLARHRVIAEYLSAFLFFLAGSAFRAGILGRRVKPRAWEPDIDWLPHARKEATATFFVMLATAWGYAAFNAVKSEIPGWLVAFAFLMMLASNPRKGRRRR